MLSLNFLTGFDSPVRAKSLHEMFCDSMTLASAGIASPCSSCMMSPMTSCVALISCIVPSLYTLECGLISFCNFSMIFDALCSCIIPIVALREMMIASTMAL